MFSPRVSPRSQQSLRWRPCERCAPPPAMQRPDLYICDFRSGLPFLQSHDIRVCAGTKRLSSGRTQTVRKFGGKFGGLTFCCRSQDALPAKAARVIVEIDGCSSGKPAIQAASRPVWRQPGIAFVACGQSLRWPRGRLAIVTSPSRCRQGRSSSPCRRNERPDRSNRKPLSTPAGKCPAKFRIALRRLYPRRQDGMTDAVRRGEDAATVLLQVEVRETRLSNAPALPSGAFVAVVTVSLACPKLHESAGPRYSSVERLASQGWNVIERPRSGGRDAHAAQLRSLGMANAVVAPSHYIERSRNRLWSARSQSLDNLLPKALRSACHVDRMPAEPSAGPQIVAFSEAATERRGRR